jgi:hypothetical protein
MTSKIRENFQVAKVAAPAYVAQVLTDSKHNNNNNNNNMSRDSAVRIGTGYWLDDRVVGV